MPVMIVMISFMSLQSHIRVKAYRSSILPSVIIHCIGESPLVDDDYTILASCIGSIGPQFAGSWTVAQWARVVIHNGRGSQLIEMGNKIQINNGRVSVAQVIEYTIALIMLHETEEKVCLEVQQLVVCRRLFQELVAFAESVFVSSCFEIIFQLSQSGGGHGGCCWGLFFGFSQNSVEWGIYLLGKDDEEGGKKKYNPRHTCQIVSIWKDEVWKIIQSERARARAERFILFDTADMVCAHYLIYM
jgi:hypothetical protein